MRIDVLARKDNETTTIHRVFINELSAMFFDWEMRMNGYKTKVIKNYQNKNNTEPWRLLWQKVRKI